MADLPPTPTELAPGTSAPDGPASSVSPARTLAGASQFAAPESHDPCQELPMVVWLRGDEDLCDEFSVGAEKAMEQLGIKRSRLTQIAGRELRVGRMRIGRYVRPVFRPEDLAAYLEATRPPATHKAAAASIEGAADEMIAKVTPVLAEFATASADLTVASRQVLLEALAEFKRRWREEQNLAGERLTLLHERTAALQRQLSGHQRLMTKLGEEADNRHDQQLAAIEVELATQSELVADQGLLLRQTLATLTSRIAALSQEVAVLLAAQAEAQAQECTDSAAAGGTPKGWRPVVNRQARLRSCRYL